MGLERTNKAVEGCEKAAVQAILHMTALRAVQYIENVSLSRYHHP